MIVAELYALLGFKIDKSSAARANKVLGGIKAGLAAVVAGIGIKKIADMVSATVELGGALQDTAIKTGLSAEALQFYGYVAAQNSSSLEEFAAATTKLSRGLDEAATTGKGPAADALKRLGINFRDASFKALSMDDKVKLVTERLGSVKDVSAQTNIGMDLMGKGFSNLIPTVKELSTNGDELRGTFKELGGGLSGDQVKALDAFGDNLDNTKARLANIKNQIVAGLVPTLEKLLARFTAWISKNKELIGTGIEKAITGVVSALEILGQIVDVVADALGFFAENTMLAKIAVGLLVFAFSPLLATIGALLGLIRLFQELRKHVGPVTAVVVTLGTAIAAAFAVGKIKAFTGAIKTAALEMLGLKTASQAAGAAGTGAAGAAAAKVGGGKAGLLGALGPIGLAVGGASILSDLTGGDIQEQAQRRGIIGADEGSLPFFEVLKRINSAQNQATVARPANGPITIGPSTFNVTVPSGDPETINKSMKTAFDEHFAGVLRQTAPAL